MHASELIEYLTGLVETFGDLPVHTLDGPAEDVCALADDDTVAAECSPRGAVSILIE
ncbi:hypothetical protein [Roseobacter weihaiensis]|uniref:hypothetical protein n=1 Tax=Roseobacter weihaiensis TaxID=2763262 RepID=UPI001D0B8749|nr:hypothetical protein [Roseobacter sp. H9]